jgi:hypothetical protein
MNNQLWLVMLFVVILAILTIFGLRETKIIPPPEKKLAVIDPPTGQISRLPLPNPPPSYPPSYPPSVSSPQGYSDVFSYAALGFPINNYWPRPDMTTFPEFSIPTYINTNNSTTGGGGGGGGGGGETPVGPVGPVLDPKLAANLVKYFKSIWPNHTLTDPVKMEQVYDNLDAYYLDFIPTKTKTSLSNYKTERLASLTAIDQDANLDFARLFDGNLCDCLRVAHKECIYSPNRLQAAELKDCPNWPYMVVNLTNAWLMKRAFDTDNPDTNFRKDTIVRNGMSGKKGYPDDSYYEGFVFPGEYAVPDLCTKAPDPFFKLMQPGLTVDGKPFNLSRSNPPWWYPPDCSSTNCEFDDEKCITVVSDGSYGGPQSKGTFKRCYRDGTYTIGDQKAAMAPARGVREYLTTTLKDDCPGGFPPNVCPEVKPADYRGYWTYPLVGCGLWWTVGKSVAVNTKLGLLLAPKSELGLGLDLDKLMDLRTRTNAFEQNLYQQVNRVAQIIKNGSVPANGTMWSAMTLDILKQNGYKGDQINDTAQAFKAAKDLVTYWYVEGHTGLDSTPHGFNYNYQKYFPLGCHFSYASRFDHLLTSYMTVAKLDSIQFLIEPQNVRVGLRPAYMFEIFSKKPRTAEAMIGSAFQDFSITNCRACFSLDPAPQIENYVKHGYLPAAAVTKKTPIDPATFLARASVKSFSPSA